MKIKKQVILLPMLLAGCTLSDAQIRQRYASHYGQPPDLRSARVSPLSYSR